jgi:hypothetical protein
VARRRGDLTFRKVGAGWRYLAIVMDPYTRRILGWSLTRRRTAAVTSAVLAKVASRHPARGVIVHRDRGSESMGAAFCACLAVALGGEDTTTRRRFGRPGKKLLLPLWKTVAEKGIQGDVDRIIALKANPMDVNWRGLDHAFPGIRMFENGRPLCP